MVYQMDVKHAFLNGDLREEFYIENLKGFEKPKNEEHIYRPKKELYVLK